MDTPENDPTIYYCVDWTRCAQHPGCPRKWDGHRFRVRDSWDHIQMRPAKLWDKCYKEIGAAHIDTLNPDPENYLPKTGVDAD
jgi:hypothetical protein